MYKLSGYILFFVLVKNGLRMEETYFSEIITTSLLCLVFKGSLLNLHLPYSFILSLICSRTYLDFPFPESGHDMTMYVDNEEENGNTYVCVLYTVFCGWRPGGGERRKKARDFPGTCDHQRVSTISWPHSHSSTFSSILLEIGSCTHILQTSRPACQLAFC